MAWAKDTTRFRKLDGLFDRLLSTFNGLKRLGHHYQNFETNFCFTFSAFNQGDIHDVSNFLSRIRVDRFSLLLVRGQIMDEGAKDFDESEYLKASEHIQALEKRRIKNIQEWIYFVRKKAVDALIWDILQGGRRNGRCLAGCLNVVIDEMGEVFPCELLRVSFGSLVDVGYHFNEIWHSSKARAFRSQLKQTRCICTHETNLMTNVSFCSSGTLELVKAIFSKDAFGRRSSL